MGYDELLARLRALVGTRVVVRLEPETSVMEGALSEIESEGLDGALFAVDAPQRTGVALAVFRDAVESAREDDGALIVQQGRVTVTVTRAG